MVKTRRSRNKQNKNKKKQIRSAAEIEEEQSRTLYIRLPRTIKSADEIKDLVLGEPTVKLPRQSSRYCHVIFSSVEDKIKNLQSLKGKEIDGKTIFVAPPRPIDLEKKSSKEKKKKKVTIPVPKNEPSCGKYILVSGIPPKVTGPEIRQAFPGSVSVVILNGLLDRNRQAKVKMSSPQHCMHYVKNKNTWPTIRDSKVHVKIPKEKAKSKQKRPQKTSESLEIYDGASEKDEESKESNEQGRDEESSRDSIYHRFLNRDELIKDILYSDDDEPLDEEDKDDKMSNE